MSKINDGGPTLNTDREIWRERPGDYYTDSIHVTASGSIGINCGGMVYTLPVREWHKLASAALSGSDGTEAETVVVPAKMFLSKGAIANLVFQCGGIEDGDPDERWCDGVMWVGDLADDDGSKPVHGLHVYSTEYPEDGSVTLSEFATRSSSMRSAK